MRELRPRFELETEEATTDLLARASRRLRAPGCPLCGIAGEGRIELYVPPARQRLWSPELRVDVWPEQGGTRLVGTYGPHPHVWMAYAALLALVLVASVAALTFALAEWTMQRPMHSLLALPPLGLVAAVLYSLAFVGQRLAAPEMDELRAFLEDVVHSSVPLPSGVRSRIPAPPGEPEREADGARRAG
jgi:hypothetical protein